jgi:hypothetical protein
MSGKRQNNQLRLAFGGEGRSEAPTAPCEGSETLTAKRMIESPAENHEQLMEEVCERENCLQAYKRVKSNKGSPGIDGMTVEELPGHLKEHWPAIREQLLSGTYKPQPVKRVEIPKPDGGVRKLGIPTVLDRLVQQAMAQMFDRSPCTKAFSWRLRLIAPRFTPSMCESADAPEGRYLRVAVFGATGLAIRKTSAQPAMALPRDPYERGQQGSR